MRFGPDEITFDIPRHVLLRRLMWVTIAACITLLVGVGLSFFWKFGAAFAMVALVWVIVSVTAFEVVALSKDET